MFYACKNPKFCATRAICYFTRIKLISPEHFKIMTQSIYQVKRSMITPALNHAIEQ